LPPEYSNVQDFTVYLEVSPLGHQ